jgi:RHS repeat-associated protein
MSTSIYNESSGQLLESRAYFDIPGSGAGSDGTNYDATFYAYDDMGRTIRVLQPHGTISRTAYDDLGRGYRQFTGTNDNGLPGGSGSGTSNMVKVSEATFDGGGDGGNSYLTKRTAYVEDSTTDMRETSFLHDVRGRAIVTLNPQAPHTLVAYDNLGRAIEVGQYSSTSGLDISDVPSTLATNRMALSKTFYNEKGQVWKTTRHKIDPADGSDDDSLESLTWHDPDGRVIKTEGEQLTKTFYDRLGRATHSFILGGTNDSGYTDADDVSGDLVLEERQTTYESGVSDNVVMSAVIQRHHTDYGVSENLGALDTNADTNAFKYAAANLKGRIQITSMWYDDLDRMIDTVQYGTNGGSDFDRKPSGFLTVPSRSATELRTSYAFNDDGTLRDVTDPRAKSTRTLYDDLGRTVATIQNYVNGTPSGVTGDDDLYTRYSYVDGLQTRMWVDLDGDDTVDGDDQVTTYIYGAVKGTPSQSKVASGHTLRAILYPDTTNTGTDHLDINSDSDDVESFAYNAQGQQTLKKDQIGNTFEMVYDTAGRLLHRRVTNLDGSFDSAVKRISTAYDTLGRVQTVTQHTHETVGSGTVVDEVKYTYEGWGMLDLFEQDRNSTVGAGGSVDDYEVNHDYDDRTGGRNTLIRTQTTYPDGVVVAMEEIDNAFSIGDDYEQARTLRMEVGGTTVAQYAYLGAGTLVGTDLLQPDVFSNRYTSGPTYGQLDRFNRPVGWTWTKDLSTDVNFYDLAIAYDENGNITRTEDNIHTAGAAGSGNGLFDALYTMDGVNRLLRAKEGHWDGSTVTDGNATRDEVWTLEQTGNWEFFKRDLDGDLDYTDTNELKDRRTHNVVNELLTRDTDDNSSVNYTFTYDDNGNMTDDGQSYTYKWDAFGRLKEVRNRSNSALVAEYKYNGLGYRIGWHYDTDADGTVESNTDDPWYLFVYDERWRVLNTYRLLDWAYNASNPVASYAKERFVYHNAGLGGWGGSSYIDSVMLRDRDAATAWNAASDGTMEERIYYAQNFRHDVSALITSDGRMIEWIKYSSYGVPWSMPAADTDSDGDFDATDASAITGTYDVRKDVNLDGTVDVVDFLEALDLNTGYVTLGWSKLGLTKWGNRKGYAGYEGDTALAGTKWHVRHRVLESELGRWMRRDPAGYVDGHNVVQYVTSEPILKLDPTGLIAKSKRPIVPIEPITCNTSRIARDGPPLYGSCPDGDYGQYASYYYDSDGIFQMKWFCVKCFGGCSIFGSHCFVHNEWQVPPSTYMNEHKCRCD